MALTGVTKTHVLSPQSTGCWSHRIVWQKKKRMWIHETKWSISIDMTILSCCLTHTMMNEDLKNNLLGKLAGTAELRGCVCASQPAVPSSHLTAGKIVTNSFTENLLI